MPLLYHSFECFAKYNRLNCSFYQYIAIRKEDLSLFQQTLNTAQQIEQVQGRTTTNGKWVLYYHGRPVDFTGVEQSGRIDDTAYVAVDLSKLENSSIWKNDAHEDGIVFRSFDEETDTVTLRQLW